jgi:hypothetical protein
MTTKWDDPTQFHLWLSTYHKMSERTKIGWTDAAYSAMIGGTFIKEAA